MELDLSRLTELHPLLPDAVANNYIHSAAVALQLRDHQPGVEVVWTMDSARREPDPTLSWKPARTDAAEIVDRIRMTEEAAEAVALAGAGAAMRWRIRRRLQRGEAADWLLESSDGRLVALEVSGIDGPFDQSRLTQKLRQVHGARNGVLKAACVVSLERPQIDMSAL